MKNNDLNLIQSEAPQSTQERHCSSVHAPKQRCTASAQVRQINYCFVCRRLICTIYFSLPGQVLSTKQLPFKTVFSTPVKSLLSAPLAGCFFPVHVDMILVGLYSSGAGAFLGGWQEQAHCLFPLKKNFDSQLNGFGSLLGALFVSFTSRQVSRSFPFPPCLSRRLVQPSRASRELPKSASCDASPAQEQLFPFLLFHVGRRAQFNFCFAATPLIFSLFLSTLPLLP